MELWGDLLEGEPLGFIRRVPAPPQQAGDGTFCLPSSHRWEDSHGWMMNFLCRGGSNRFELASTAQPSSPGFGGVRREMGRPEN